MAKQTTETQRTAARTLVFQNGQSRPMAIAPEKTEAVFTTARWLLTNAEPMRIALEEEEMAALKTNGTGFEIFFAPPLNADVDPSGVTRMLFLQSGNYANGAQIADARFFIALGSGNGAYISSPYVANGAAAKVTQLQQLIGE